MIFAQKQVWRQINNIVRPYEYNFLGPLPKVEKLTVKKAWFNTIRELLTLHNVWCIVKIHSHNLLYEIFAIHLRKFGIKCRRRNAIWCYIIICLYENMILFKNLHTFSFIASGARLYSAKAHRRNRMNSCKFRVKVIIFTTPHPAHGYWKRDSFMQMKNPKIPPKNIWFDFVVAFVRN